MGIVALVHVVVVLLLAGFALGVSISFSVRPSERKLAVLRPTVLALVFAVLSSTFAGVALTARSLADRAPIGIELVRQLFAGLAEAMVLGVVGFAAAAFSWALVAAGLRRQD